MEEFAWPIRVQLRWFRYRMQELQKHHGWMYVNLRKQLSFPVESIQAAVQPREQFLARHRPVSEYEHQTLYSLHAAYLPAI